MIDPPEKESKTSKGVLLEYVSEIIGYEKGLYKTLIDLRTKPIVVVDSYLDQKGIYASPFKFLITVAGIWFVVNNFVFDWNKVMENNVISLKTFLDYYVFNDPAPISAEEMLVIKNTAKIASEIITKYYVALVLFLTPVWAYFAYQFCKPFKIDFRTHFIVVGYHYSLTLIPTLLITWCVAINFLATIVLLVILKTIQLLRTNIFLEKIFSIVPLREFFRENGPVIESRYRYARLLAIFLLMVPMVGWLVYSMKDY